MRSLISLLGTLYAISTITGIVYFLFNKDVIAENHSTEMKIKLYNKADLKKGSDTYNLDTAALVFQYETCYFYRVKGRLANGEFIEKFILKEDSILNHVKITKADDYSITCDEKKLHQRSSSKSNARVKKYQKPRYIPYGESRPSIQQFDESPVWRSNDRLKKNQKPTYIPYDGSKVQQKRDSSKKPVIF